MWCNAYWYKAFQNFVDFPLGIMSKSLNAAVCVYLSRAFICIYGFALKMRRLGRNTRIP